MEYKKKDILHYSNPLIVRRLLNKNKCYGPKVPFHISTRKDKKYMVQDPKGKWIHFGQYGYEDYTKHKDKERRKRFLSRNKKWSQFPPYTPAHLSYYLLW